MKRCQERFNQIILIFCFISGILLLNPAFGNEDQADKQKQAVKNPRLTELHDEILNKLSPEQQAQLKKLQKENPEAFRKEIKTIVRRYKNKDVKAAKQKEIYALVAKYGETADANEKEQLLVQIKAKVTEQFTEKMETNRRNIEKTEKRLDELKTQLQKRQDNSSSIVEERVKELTKDPSLKW